jgi:hypothetical protein
MLLSKDNWNVAVTVLVSDTKLTNLSLQEHLINVAYFMHHYLQCSRMIGDASTHRANGITTGRWIQVPIDGIAQNS